MAALQCLACQGCPGPHELPSGAVGAGRARLKFERAARIEPANPYVCHAWGLMEEQLGHADAAARIYARGMRVDPQPEVCVAWAALEAQADLPAPASRAVAADAPSRPHATPFSLPLPTDCAPSPAAAAPSAGGVVQIWSGFERSGEERMLAAWNADDAAADYAAAADTPNRRYSDTWLGFGGTGLAQLAGGGPLFPLPSPPSVRVSLMAISIWGDDEDGS